MYKIAELAPTCRELGFEVQGNGLEDFPTEESDDPNSYYQERKRQVEAADNAKRISAATATAEAAKARSDAATQSNARLSGELLSLIAALGHGADESQGKAAFALFESAFKRSRYAVGDITRTYFTASDAHAEGALIEGVGAETSRDEVIACFGEAEWSNDHPDRFWIAADTLGKVFLRVEYVDGRVVEVSVTHEAAENRRMGL